MHDMPLLHDAVWIFALAVVVLFVCHRLRMPALVGFLLTGLLAGPHGLGVVGEVRQVEALAEVGVILLLFTIGIEISFDQLLAIRRLLLGGGFGQVAGTVAVVATLALWWGFPPGRAVFWGFLLALSSTAIVLKLLQKRAELDSPHGRVILGILIFQDLVIVPMMLLTPYLAGSVPVATATLAWQVGKGLGVALLVAAGARWLIPPLLRAIVATRDQELFLLAVVLLCLGVAWLTGVAGLSLALGAFIAGMVLASSEYGHHALGRILPFRDVFSAFFFVSIGMMLDLGYLAAHPLAVSALALLVFLGKGLVAALVALLLGQGLRQAVLIGAGLAQVGEFSFVLSRVGVASGLLAGNRYQLFLATAIVTMALTPFLYPLAARAAAALDRLAWPAALVRARKQPEGEETAGATLTDHLVIIGYGVNGRNLARAAGAVSIPFVVVEMNPDTVERERRAGVPMIYGDASHEPVLHQAQIHRARVAVIAINDPSAIRRMTVAIRQAAPTIHLVVRTRYLDEMAPLLRLGADEVIPEEFETSVEIFSRVLAWYLVPRETIEEVVAEVRADGYRMLRSLAPAADGIAPVQHLLTGIEVRTLPVAAESPLCGRTIGELGLRSRFGVTVVAIRRGTEVLDNPGAATRLAAGDLLFFLGPAVKVQRALDEMLAAGDSETAPG